VKHAPPLLRSRRCGFDQPQVADDSRLGEVPLITVACRPAFAICSMQNGNDAPYIPDQVLPDFGCIID
jgi:hypothetical protein